jgi:hypothetical protein
MLFGAGFHERGARFFLAAMGADSTPGLLCMWALVWAFCANAFAMTVCCAYSDVKHALLAGGAIGIKLHTSRSRAYN